MRVEVLHVDDERSIRSALSRMLNQANLSYASVASGPEALAWLEKNQAEIILSDYRMPGMTGTELLAKIEAQWPNTKRIILSAHSDFDTVLKAVHSGVVHKFLAKPWSNQELIEHLTALLKPNDEVPSCITAKQANQNSEKTASDVQLQAVMDTVVDGMVTISAEGLVLSVNTAVERIFGYSPNELLQQNVSMLMPEPYRSQHDHYLAQYKKPGTKGILGNQRRLVGLRKNGEVFPIELSVNAMDIAGETQFLGMIRDISRRVSAERENELLLGALAVAQDGVALFDPADKLLHCNQQFRSLYESAGVTVSIGDTYQDFFLRCLDKGLFNSRDANSQQWLKRQLELHQQLPVTQQYELLPNQWIEIHETRAENGSVIVSHLDITKQKQTERSLEKAVAAAEHANSARGRFLAMMSHEIRTPLNGVLGLLQLLEETPLSADQKSYVASALSSGQGLLTVITDILDFSKIEADKLVLQPSAVRLAHLVSDIRRLFMLRIEEKSIGFHLQYDESLPEWVELDGQRLRQVLINLIGNAIKFTDYGDVTITIRSNVARITFEIKDTGIGIPEAEQGDIFSEFTTIKHKNNTKLYEGTGLGLAISHKLVGLMGGKLSFSSTEGEGTTFFFSLPLQATAPLNDDHKHIHNKLSGHVLIVDDSATNRLVAKTMLKHLDLITSTADGSDQAIALCKQQRFDLVLMDISMPDRDGIETFQAIKQLPEWNNAPVIAFTAYAHAEDKQKFVHAGMQGHLEKPIDKTVLIQTITPFLAVSGIQSCETSHSDDVQSDSKTSKEKASVITEQLDALARDTSEELLPELAEVFLKDASERLSALVSGSHDAESTERHLHTLGSSALLYGLRAMSDLARELEGRCKRGESVVDSLDAFICLAKASLENLDKAIKARQN